MSETLTAASGWPAVRLASWALPVALGVVGVIAQSFTYLNHDVAWVLWSSGRLLDGGVFGRDIVAANPPLIWWVSALPMAISRLTGMTAVTAFNLFMMAMLTLSLMSSDRLLRGAYSSGMRMAFLGIAAILLSLGAGRDFGQREHMTVILVLPYLLLVLARVRNENYSASFATLIGMAAAIGFAFKPHLMAVPLLAEGFLLTQIGLRRTLWRPEVAAAAATVVLYVAAVLVFARPYLFEALPDIAQVYWAFNKPDALSFASRTVIAGPVLIVALLMLPVKRWPVDASLFVIAAAGFMVAAILQWKAYSYHLYPVFAFSILAIMLMAFTGGVARTVALMVIAFYAVLPVRSLLDRLPSGPTGADRVAIVDFVNANTPQNGRFLAMSTHPFPGFPTALHTHATWASASNSRIFLPAVVKLSTEAQGAGTAEALRFAATKEHAAMLRDMTPPPDLVIVDTAPYRHAIYDTAFDFLAFYREDPAFDALWSNYREVDGAPPGYRAYVFNRGGQP